jgi:hypothetical protein
MDPERDVSDVEEDLRSTAEDIVADASELKSIEKKKARMAPGDPGLVELARAAGELGEEIAAKTAMELKLAKDATGA